MRYASCALAVLGAGSVTLERHLPAVRAVGGRPVSVFDPCPEAAAEAARLFSIPHVASTFEEAIRNEEVETVLVASPNAFHREQAECSLAEGRHVLCEKPAALNLADARAMLDAANRSGKVLQLGFAHRFNAENVCIKRLVECGILGDVRAYSGILSEPLGVIPGGLQLPCLLSSTYPGRDVPERRFSCLSFRMARFGWEQLVGVLMRRPAVRGWEARAARDDPRGAGCRAGRRACA